LVTPLQTGQLQIHVLCQNQPIKNSPINLIIFAEQILPRDPRTILNQPKLIVGLNDSPGNADGQFNSPTAVCVNSKGEIIVAEQSNHRIQIFNADGRFSSKFAVFCQNEAAPAGLSIDKSDHIYVAGYAHNRILVFNANGNQLLKTIGKLQASAADGQFNGPRGVYVDEKHESGKRTILVTDSNNHRVQILDQNGRFIHKFGSQGDGPSQLQNPWGIFVNSKREIIVSEFDGNRLQAFDYQGNHLRFIGIGQVQRPANLFIDELDHIYVGGMADNTIKVFEGNTGQLIHSFGQGILNAPSGVWISPLSKTNYVASHANHIMAVF